MADQTRAQEDAVTFLQRLADHPSRYGFYAAMRRLNCLYRERPRTGEAPRPRDDAIRLCHEPSLAFAPATLSSCQPHAMSGHWRLTSYFFGLTGPNGPLPLHLTEFARARMREHQDETFSRFLDLFHHRALSLFYRSWATAQPTTSFDRPEEDRFSIFMGSLIGIGLSALRDRDALPDSAKLHHASYLACHTRHAPGLARMLSNIFQLPIEIEEFVGQWIRLPEECRCHLGDRRGMTTLGKNTTIGERVWNRQSKFRILLGPVDLTDYQRFLPGQPGLKRLKDAVRNYAGDEFDWEVRLTLRREHTPQATLGGQGRLGWTSWLLSNGAQSDRDDLGIANTAILDASPADSKPT